MSFAHLRKPAAWAHWVAAQRRAPLVHRPRLLVWAGRDHSCDCPGERRLHDGGSEPDPRPARAGAPRHGRERPGGTPAGGRGGDAGREEHEGRDAEPDRQREGRPRAGARAGEARRRLARRDEAGRAWAGGEREPERPRPAPSHGPDDGGGARREGTGARPERHGPDDVGGGAHADSNAVNASSAPDDGCGRRELADGPPADGRRRRRRRTRTGDADDGRRREETGESGDRHSRHGVAIGHMAPKGEPRPAGMTAALGPTGAERKGRAEPRTAEGGRSSAQRSEHGEHGAPRAGRPLREVEGGPSFGSPRGGASVNTGAERHRFSFRQVRDGSACYGYRPGGQ